jgi:hypothetical protein
VVLSLWPRLPPTVAAHDWNPTTSISPRDKIITAILIAAAPQ